MNVKVMPKNAWLLLPPAPHLCQVCASDHPPDMPHNPQSLYYQFKYQIDQGRDVTWLDAWAHCTPDVQDEWRRILVSMGVDVDAGQIVPEKSRQENSI